ncbi:MAG: NADH-quinone oxidoreductase subunit J [Isosphaeraceae bacterium]
MIQVLFMVIAGLGLAAALGTILARNLVHAGLFLVAFFFAVACQFVLLEAEFLAALQVLVYIGAVAILLMFGIMLTRNIQGDDPTSVPSSWRLPGLIAGLGVFMVLAYGISFQKGIGSQLSWTTRDVRPTISAATGEGAPPRSRAVNEMGRIVGEELMKRYVIAFEVAGLLLTVALVGAIAISHREEAAPAVSRAGAAAARQSGDGDSGRPGAREVASTASTV